MLLLFEGVDKSGKSTLIENLIKAGVRVSGYWKNPQKPKATQYWKGKIEGIYFGFYEATKAMGLQYPFIVDRSHITEAVYAKPKRKYTPASFLDYEKTMNAVVIYVDTPLETILERNKREKDDYVKSDEFSVLKKRYERYLKLTKLDVIRIDGSGSQEEMLQELIVKLYEYLGKKNFAQEGP